MKTEVLEKTLSRHYLLRHLSGDSAIVYRNTFKNKVNGNGWKLTKIRLKKFCEINEKIPT